MQAVLISSFKKFIAGVRKKYFVAACFIGVVAAGSMSFTQGKNDDHFVNLKVLPKNISSKKLSEIMVDDFTAGLGVSCGFCHAEEKDSHKLDYASDANPQKNVARAMMRMTLKLNKKYFEVKHPLIGDSVMVVTCITCHRGTAFPYPAE
jgi:hypothetical protein